MNLFSHVFNFLTCRLSLPWRDQQVCWTYYAMFGAIIIITVFYRLNMDISYHQQGDYFRNRRLLLGFLGAERALQRWAFIKEKGKISKLFFLGRYQGRDFGFLLLFMIFSVFFSPQVTLSVLLIWHLTRWTHRFSKYLFLNWQKKILSIVRRSIHSIPCSMRW